MVGLGSNREESVGSQCENQFVNLERRRDREVNHLSSVHTSHTSRSHSSTRSHVSHREETWNLRLEIDHLCRKLCCKQREASPLCSETDISENGSYRLRSRTPHSKSFFVPS